LTQPEGPVDSLVRLRYYSVMELQWNSPIVQIFFALLLAILPLTISEIPVMWKCVLWALAWGIMLHFGHTFIPGVARLPIAVKTSLAIGLSAFLVAAAYIPVFEIWREEKAAVLEGDLLGGEKGEILPDSVPPWVQISDSAATFMMLPPKAGQPLQPYFDPFHDDAEFRVEGGKEAPLISTIVRDRSGNMVVEIKRNHWRVYPPYCSDKNYTQVAFEVKDNSGHVLLQIKFIPNPGVRVQVQGEWWSNENRGVRILKAKDGQGYVIPLVPGNQHNDELIKPIFKYSSKHHWGEFDTH